LKTNYDVFSSKFAQDIYLQKYSMNGQETWKDTCERVVSAVCGQRLSSKDKEAILNLMLERKFIPGGRYLYSAGRPFHQVNNCFLFRAEDSREGWAEALQKATAALMTGGGIGFNYNNLRAKGAVIKRTGGVSTGPISLMNMVNEAGRYVMQGGQRRSAIYASLLWSHGDVFDFLAVKNHSKEMMELKAKDFTFPLPMELTNISVDYDTEFFIAIENAEHPKHEHAKKVWELNCRQAFSTAEPGFMFNFRKDNENLRNACTEVVSEDDSDKCNLGTLWINRFTDKKEFGKAVHYATLFLLCGHLYSDVPFEKIREVGNRNNRIGLGLGGIHEWLMLRGSDYQVTPELHKWLSIYEQESDAAAFVGAKQLEVAVPKGVRAIAPTGTLSILAETSSGIEPLFCKAYKRRYYKDGKWLMQYVVDGAVKRLVENGVKIEQIQDSYDLNFKQRVKFQADVQNYVDMAISSTCNMPSWGSDENNEAALKKNSDTLLKYAKRLRGFTVYPDGCRMGQPLTRVDLKEALEAEGKVFEENETECIGGVCGV
jgi:ribonucleoside-diphosphate reductase alpha chain